MGRVALREPRISGSTSTGEDELERARRDASRTTSDLDELAYAASHDLRAPLVCLSQLVGELELELGDADCETVRRHLAEVRRQVRRSDTLLQGIGQFWRAGAGPVRPRVERVTLEQLVGRAQGALALESPPGARVEASPGALLLELEAAPVTEALRCLIDNALRHAAKDDVHVQVSAAPHDEGGWAFLVSDDGPGIPPAYRDRVWRLFFTLKPRRGDAGPGIGLAVVRRLVESRGGAVWIADAPSGGASVGFTWPPP
jgi:signal transduction histidine kinase